MKFNRENLILVGIFLGLAGVTAWLQLAVLEPPKVELSEVDLNAPDYYLTNFVSTGLDENGHVYKLEADRMVHYPKGDRALLDRPHVIQFDSRGQKRHVYAKSGWLYNNTSEILLTDDVRVIQSHTGSAGGVAVGDKMKIRLKNKDG